MSYADAQLEQAIAMLRDPKVIDAIAAVMPLDRSKVELACIAARNACVAKLALPELHRVAATTAEDIHMLACTSRAENLQRAINCGAIGVNELVDAIRAQIGAMLCQHEATNKARGDEEIPF